MTCEETQALLGAYVDGELDLVHALDVERHLQGCPACGPIYQDLQALRSALHADALYAHAPAGLERRVQAALRQAAAAPMPAPRAPWWRGLGLVAALAALLLVAWGLGQWASAPAPTPDAPLTADVITAHVRSLQVNHLADVVSTDQHTVKPWFAGKLDFSPPVTDFVAQGYPLTGGRLDYLAGRPVAAIVYARHAHHINLFVWPAADPAAPPVTTTQDGWNVIHWQQGGMAFWAVSDLNLPELQAFVALVRGA